MKLASDNQMGDAKVNIIPFAQTPFTDANLERLQTQEFQVTCPWFEVQIVVSSETKIGSRVHSIHVSYEALIAPDEIWDGTGNQFMIQPLIPYQIACKYKIRAIGGAVLDATEWTQLNRKLKAVTLYLEDEIYDEPPDLGELGSVLEGVFRDG